MGSGPVPNNTPKRIWLAGVASIGLLTAFGFSPIVEGRMVDRVAAVVNGDVVLHSEVERFSKILPLRKEIDPLFSLSDLASKERASYPEVLDFLVSETLVQQQFKVTETEVEQEVRGVMKQNNLDDRQLQQFLSSRGFTLEDYRGLMRTGLQKRNLLDREIRGRVNISDEDVRNFYFNNLLSKAPESLEYSLNLLILNGSDFKNLATAEEQGRKALAALKQGQSFDDVSRTLNPSHSSDLSFDPGWLSADHLNPALKQPIQSLKLGAFGPVVVAEQKVYIFKLVSARSQEDKRFEEQKERIRESLAKDEYKKQLRLWNERSRAASFVKVNFDGSR